MAKTETAEKASEEKPATEAQLSLIKQLQEELNIKHLPEEYQGIALNRKEASNCIHLLKETKVRDQALRAANTKSVVFDKIGFGMVYKLVWKACLEAPHASKPSRREFIDAVIGEYQVFKAAQKACREHVQEGGLK